MLTSVFVSCVGDDNTTTTDIPTTEAPTTEAPTTETPTTEAPTTEAPTTEDPTDDPSVKYNITYELNGGVNNVNNPYSYKAGEHVHLSSPKKEGYAFDGWYTDPEFKNRTSLITDSDGNITIYAKWNDVYNLFVLELEGDSYTIVDYDRSAEFKGIPSSFNGKPITKIGNYAFEGCKNLTSVVIPDNITYIGSRAFRSCSNLKEITIPDSVTSSLKETFEDCMALTEVTIGSGVPSVDNAFFNCRSLCKITVSKENNSLRSAGGILYGNGGKELICFPATLDRTVYEIPDGVTDISDNAFSYAKLVKEIKFPKTFKNFNDNAFYKCDIIESFTVDSENADFKSIDGVLLSKDGTKLVRYPIAKEGASYTIPEGVTSVEKYAFKYCSSLKDVIIPKTVNKIGERAFYGCSSLVTIEIPEGVTKLEEFTFNSCSALSTVILSSNIKILGSNVFANCMNLKNITLPEGLEVLGDGAFSYCESLLSISIPKGVTKIEDYAFYIAYPFRE
jgi:uncharacterized repeat protein (TIGR02543 family)